MFDANRVLIDAFVSSARQAYRETYPGVAAELEAGLERATRTALLTLRSCDCPYHDLEHTLLVTDAGITMEPCELLEEGGRAHADRIR